MAKLQLTMRNILVILIFFYLLFLTSCFNENNNLSIRNLPIICTSDTSPDEEIQVSLVPIMVIFQDMPEPINIGTIKNGKLNIVFPNNMDNKYLVDMTEAGYTVTEGHKILPFYLYPIINIMLNKTSEKICTIDYIIYSNKKGRITRGNEEILNLNKGWNFYREILHDGKIKLEKLNIKEYYKKTYSWYCFKDFIDKDGYFIY